VELLQAFQQHPWLNMLHLHVGSQGLQLDTVIAGEGHAAATVHGPHSMRTYVHPLVHQQTHAPSSTFPCIMHTA
jgi:hypothetical protein